MQHTVIWLKLWSTAIFTIFLQTSLLTRASVVITWSRYHCYRTKMYAHQKEQERKTFRKTYTKHGSHVWMDHPRTFCHSSNSYIPPSNLKQLTTKLRLFLPWIPLYELQNAKSINLRRQSASAFWKDIIEWTMPRFKQQLHCGNRRWQSAWEDNRQRIYIIISECPNH